MGLKVGVLGVGPVGEHIVRILEERKFPMDGSAAIMAESVFERWHTSQKAEHFVAIRRGYTKTISHIWQKAWNSVHGRKHRYVPALLLVVLHCDLCRLANMIGGEINYLHLIFILPST